MTFDMNVAWREASRMIRANAQVLAILAGVFFFLPTFATEIFAPMPEPATGMGGEQYMKMVSAYYAGSATFLVLVAITQAIGVLALLALLSDRRPTVGEALKAGAASLVPYIAAQLLIGLGIGFGLVVLFGVGVTAGAKALAVLLVPLALVGFAYITTKMSLVAPVMVIDGLRNPVGALRRSWQLTRGNSLRLFLFYFLVLIAFLVVMLLAGILGGLVTTVVLGAGTLGQAVQGLVSGLIGAVMVVYFVAIIAATHRQLSGPSTGEITETFR